MILITQLRKYLFQITFLGVSPFFHGFGKEKITTFGGQVSIYFNYFDYFIRFDLVALVIRLGGL